MAGKELADVGSIEQLIASKPTLLADEVGFGLGFRVRSLEATRKLPTTQLQTNGSKLHPPINRLPTYLPVCVYHRHCLCRSDYGIYMSMRVHIPLKHVALGTKAVHRN